MTLAVLAAGLACYSAIISAYALAQARERRSDIAALTEVTEAYLAIEREYEALERRPNSLEQACVNPASYPKRA